MPAPQLAGRPGSRWPSATRRWRRRRSRRPAARRGPCRRGRARTGARPRPLEGAWRQLRQGGGRRRARRRQGRQRRRAGWTGLLDPHGRPGRPSMDVAAREPGGYRTRDVMIGSGRRDEGRRRHGRRRGCGCAFAASRTPASGSTAPIAIHSTANRRLDAAGNTTTFTVPWMAKWSSAGAQIVARLRARQRRASGKATITASSRAAAAIGHGIVAGLRARFLAGCSSTSPDAHASPAAGTSSAPA